MENTNVKVSWLGTIISDSEINEATKWFNEQFDLTTAKYEGTIITNPTKSGNGGRHDAIFSMSYEDSKKFAIKRLFISDMKWSSDVIDNEPGVYSDEDCKKYNIVSWL